ncbi:MAG TPA: hypothetical protein DEB47_01235 [Citreicella sp.]|nr:hypothetical protein [Citreicella sp.]
MTSKINHTAGSHDWLTMVGEVLQAAARSAALPDDLNLSLVEHYIDGSELSPGLFQGLRFDIRNGVPGFCVGVAPHEVGDITIKVTALVAQRLNQIYSSDPAYAQVQQEARASGELCVSGDPSRLGAWFAAAHDDIVRRTAGSPPAAPRAAP